MDEELDGMLMPVRADVRAFAQDVAQMRGVMETSLAQGAERAGRAIETSLLRAVRSGKFGFEELGKIALSVLADIAAAALRNGSSSMSMGGMASLGGGLGGGLASLAAGIVSAIGLPGRATGGPVSPGRGYVVGERGPELFVPTSSGQVVPAAPAQARDVRVAIRIEGNGSEAPRMLARSARQVARAVRSALAD